MKLGTLPVELKLKPMIAISPSNYNAMRDCPLRTVWSKSGNDDLLPRSAKLFVGNVSHKIIELANKNEFVGQARIDVEKKWDQLIADKEAQLSKSRLERKLVPLRRSVYRYEVIKIRNINKVTRIMASNQHRAAKRTVALSITGAEQPMQSLDGLIRGTVDRIAIENGKTIIRDYKTGDIFDKSTGGVKESYQIQLKIYAYIFHQKYQRWPDVLELEPLNGPPIIVDFDPHECIQIAEDAKTLLAGINRQIVDDIPCSLANPSPDTCRWCGFRPMCKKYHQTRIERATETDWPTDLFGKLVSKTKTQSGAVTLAVQRHDGSTVRVREVNYSTSEHPAINEIKEGQMIALYNLRHREKLDEYCANILTTIYITKDR